MPQRQSLRGTMLRFDCFSPRHSMNTTLALALSTVTALALAPAASAASPDKGQAHFILMKSRDEPFVGVTLRGACKSDDGAFFGGKKVESPWSCTTNADGVCMAEIALLPRTDSDKANACKGTMATEITEPGAPTVKSSYFTFFAHGEPHNYNLLQKMGSWKHGDYHFKSLESKDSFDAIAARHAPGYYKSKIAIEDSAARSDITLSTAAAHVPESKSYPSMEYLRARIDRQSLKPTVQIVVKETYIDFSYRNPISAKFVSAAGPKSAEVTRIDQNVICNLRDLLERKCTHQETVAFDIDIDTLRQAAAAYKPGERKAWTFQVVAQSGHARDLSLSHAEFLALTEALDGFLAKNRK